MVKPSQMQHAVEDQDTQLLFDAVAQCGGLLRGAIEGNRQFAQR